MKIGRNVQLGVLIAAQAALVLVVLFVTYLPSLDEMQELDRKMGELGARQTELCRAIETSPNPDADIQLAKAEIRRLESRMPPESRVNWLSARIADVMRTCRVDPRSATDWQEAGAKPPAAELKPLEKTMTVSCSASDLEAFLEALNKLPFVVVVEELDMRRDEASGAVSATVRLATFVLRASPPRQPSTAATGGGHST